MTERNYVGDWILLPELSFYQSGQAPESGRYRIGVANGIVDFAIDWRDKDQKKSIRFAAPLDGILHPSDLAPEGRMCCAHIDADTLESRFVIDGTEVAAARRQVSGDGTLMAVLQMNRLPDRTWSRITQVYRRSSS